MHHWYLSLISDEEERQKVDARLTGPLSSKTPTGFTRPTFRPPTWWRGDEQATRSSLAAMQELKHRM